MDIRVNKCCCCCTLQTGTKIIGGLYLFIGASLIIWDSILIANNEDYSFSIVGIIVSAILIAVTIPLLMAATRDSRPKLIVPWLILNVIVLVLIIGSSLYLSVAIILPLDLTAGIFYIVIILIGFALGIYFWLVIYSYYQLLLEVETRPSSANDIPMLQEPISINL